MKRRVRAMLKNQVMEGLLSVTPVDVCLKVYWIQECVWVSRRTCAQDMEQAWDEG